jgi:hypothetical protein
LREDEKVQIKIVVEATSKEKEDVVELVKNLSILTNILTEEENGKIRVEITPKSPPPPAFRNREHYLFERIAAIVARLLL